MTTRVLLFLLLFLVFPCKFNTVSGQGFQNSQQAEDSLAGVLASLNLAKDDSTKRALNQVFFQVLSDALKLASSDNHPFESLKTLVKINSPDGIFRIFQWNLPASDGKNHYYGFLKMLNHDPPMVYPLVDVSDSLPDPDTLILDNVHWLGALYYKIITGETAAGNKIYTLLGWAGRSSLITQKVIEVLFFDDYGKPHFGKKLFADYQKGNLTRIIFRYAANTTMSMKYEKQTISANKRWNSKKRIFDYSREETLMIVCDRMVPLDPQLEGQYQYYIAAGDIFDGFVFQHYCWKFIPGIETKNRK